MTKLETSAKKYDIRGESGAGGFWEQTNGPHIAGALLYTGDKTNPPSRLVSPFSLLRSSPLDAANFIIRPSSSPLFLRHFVMFIVHRGGEFLRSRLSLREEDSFHIFIGGGGERTKKLIHQTFRLFIFDLSRTRETRAKSLNFFQHHFHY